MDIISHFAGDDVDRYAAQRVLKGSLRQRDEQALEDVRELVRLGCSRETAPSLLACYKSREKYGYELSVEAVEHVRQVLAKTPQRALLDRPFFLMKTCWLYEHAPCFIRYDRSVPNALDDVIRDFARHYDIGFLQHRVDTSTWSRTRAPYRLRSTTFWERQHIDPVFLIEQALRENLEGLEISTDFHPFNYTKVLPEELSDAHRVAIRKACERSDMRLDLHSPLIGPYVPQPSPTEGEQRFFDPVDLLPLQFETIELAQDVKAEAVTFHLVRSTNIDKLARLVAHAAGSDVRVTIENYCQTEEKQTSEMFLDCLSSIRQRLPDDVRKRNLGVTLDVGHFNIEGEDPLLAAVRVGKWCRQHGVYLRMHATENYGKLLFSPPAYSADVHGNVSGRGINNALIIQALRSLGLHFSVVAEQIKPLTAEDIATVHNAQTVRLDKSYEQFAETGRKRLSNVRIGAFLKPDIIRTEAYRFLAGLQGTEALREYVVYRAIQEKKHLSVDEAKRISGEFMQMPARLKQQLTTYIDDLLLPVQTETGMIQKTQVDLICQNINGALFWSLSNEHMDQIFARKITYGRGDTICRQNTPGTEMYFIREGRAGVYIDSTRVAELGAGEIFGEISLFYNIARSATIKAEETPTVIGALNRQDLENLLKSREPHVFELIFRLYNVLPNRLRNMNDKYKAAIQTLSLILNEDAQALTGTEWTEFGAALQHANVLPTLSVEEAGRIYRESRHYETAEHIFAEGDEADGVYLLFDGQAKVMVASSDGREVLLGELAAGEVFGEMALIDNKPRSASVVALCPCEVGFISRVDFNEFIQGGSELAFRLMGFICLSLFRRILRLDRIYSDVKERIASSETRELRIDGAE